MSSLSVSCNFAAGALNCVWCVALLANTRVVSKKRCRESSKINEHVALDVSKLGGFSKKTKIVHRQTFGQQFAEIRRWPAKGSF